MELPQNEGASYIVAFVGNNPIGFLQFRGNLQGSASAGRTVVPYTVIDALEVLPRYRRKGVAKALLRVLEGSVRMGSVVVVAGSKSLNRKPNVVKLVSNMLGMNRVMTPSDFEQIDRSHLINIEGRSGDSKS